MENLFSECFVGSCLDFINDVNNSFLCRHVDSTERHGKKPYRNAASVFSIDEGGSSGNNFRLKYFYSLNVFQFFFVFD